MEADPCLMTMLFIESIVFNSFSIKEVIELITILILLFFSAMVSGSEVAFFSLEPSQINKLKSKKNKRGKILLEILSKPKDLLATILIVNNFVNVGIVILSSLVTNQLIDFSASHTIGFVFQVVVITFILLLVGEILPKVYSSHNNYYFALVMAIPIYIVGKIFYPISKLLVLSTTIVDKRLRIKKTNISMSDISNALDLTDSGELKEDKKILKGIVKFGNIDVKEIMKPRVDSVSVDISFNLNKILSVAIDSGYSRIPVFANSFDNIKGILYTKDLLPHLHKGDQFRWQSLIRPPYYVPETKKINDLLEEFQQRKIHMAIVIDEFGGTSGIITMEDILEEIVGDITDEYDQEDLLFSKIDENNYIFEGKISLNDFNKILNLNNDIYEHISGEPDTLAGLILEIKGEFPKKNDLIIFNNFEFKIKSVDARRIKQVYLKILNKN